MKSLKESLQNSSKINEVRRVSNVTGKDLYDGFVNILKKCKSPEELNKYIDSSDKNKYIYAAEIAYMYLEWVTVGYEEYANDAGNESGNESGNEAWEEYGMNIALTGFDDFCDEWCDFAHDEHEQEYDEVYSSMENVITKVVPKIYYTINHKHITIPKTSEMY